MSTKVYIPSAMRDATNNVSAVSGDGSTVKEVFSDIERQYPGFRDKLYNSEGKMHQYIACFVNDTDMRSLENDATELSDRDEITIIAAIAGG